MVDIDAVKTAAELVQVHLVDAMVESKKAATLAAFGTIATTDEELKESAVAAYDAYQSLNRVAEKLDALMHEINGGF